VSTVNVYIFITTHKTIYSNIAMHFSFYVNDTVSTLLCLLLLSSVSRFLKHRQMLLSKDTVIYCYCY